MHVRLTDQNGVVIFDNPSIQVIGASSGGGGGGGTVDPTTILATGDFKWRATTETLTGFVKANATTIGSATSGASQRANADTQNLYTYLWTNFNNAHCPVTGGRGASAAADFSAAKKIQLPDLRSRSPFGLDDMGSSAAGRILASNVTSGGGDGVTTAAATGGEGNHTLAIAEIPTGLHLLTDLGHVHGGVPSNSVAYGLGSFGAATYSATQNTNSATTGITLTDHAGGGTHNNMSPFILGTWFIKL